jgi:ABC-type hemin transport system substrate-binding protein
VTIAPFLEGEAFGPQDIQAMSMALEDVCKILDLADEAKSERERLAKKIIALAHQGEVNAALLRDRTLRDVAYGQGEWAASLVRSARHGAL